MEFYNKKNKPLIFEGFDLFTKGGCAYIYKRDDILLKVYDLNCKYRYYMSRKMFELLKKNDIPNLVKLYDYFRIFRSRILPMDAYTMKYVGGNNVKLIKADREYLSDIGNQLDETIIRLTDKKIVIFDAQCDNILFKENGVTIIDPDQFVHKKLATKKAIYNFNKMQALSYIRDTITREMNSSGNYEYNLPLIFPEEESIKNSILSLAKEGNIEDSITEKGDNNAKVYSIQGIKQIS